MTTEIDTYISKLKELVAIKDEIIAAQNARIEAMEEMLKIQKNIIDVYKLALK